MLPRPHRAIANFAVVVIVVSMLLSTIPPELGAKFDQRYTTTNESFTLYFDETFEYESVHSVLSNQEILSIDSMGYNSDLAWCIGIRWYYSGWNCDDYDDSNNICVGGCYLEYEEYTVDVEFVYGYEIRHHGSATFDVSTIWSSGSAPVSTVTLSSSTENFVVSAKVYLHLEITRTFVGATQHQNTVRQPPIDIIFPFVSPYDIDGGGNSITVGFTTFYVWDDYVQFATISGQNNAFGTTLDLDGDIPIASIDLLEVASELIDDIYPQVALALDALGYVIEVNLEITLDLEVDILSRVQTFLGTDSISSIRSVYWGESSRAAYGNLLSNQGSFTSSVAGSGTDVNGVLGLHHMISTQESYSTHLVIEPETDTTFGQTIWNFFTTASSYSIELSTGGFLTSSSGSSSLLTSEDFTVDAPQNYGGGGGSGNSPPTSAISFTSTAQSSIQIEVGDTVTVSTSGTSDPDGDSLTGSLNWGDGNSESWNQGIPSTTSHTYNSVGSYGISALASDGSNNSFSNVLSVNVVAAQFAGTMGIEVYPDPIISNQGLVGHWTMDDSSGSITDSSGYLHWGVPHGSPDYDVEGRFHRAIEFDGTDDYFDAGPAIVNLVGNSEEFTLSAWVNTASSGSMQIINAGIGNSWLGSLMILSIEEGNARVAVPATDMNYPEVLSTSDVNDGDWHLITGTFVSSGSNSELNLYIDGTLDGTLSGFTWDTRELNHENQYNDDFYIGTENKDSPSGSYYSGLLDEVSVHDRALTATEVSNMFSSASANPQSVTEGQLVSLVYTASSGDSGLNYYIGDDAGAWQYVPASGTEMQGSLSTSWTSHGSYFPSIHVYDADWNHIGYHSTEVEAVPDISNGGLNGSSFEIVGDQILIVMDDEGYELGVNRTAAPHLNSNNSVAAITEALATVSRIREVDFDVILVGDTDWDYKTDTPGADGPGLNFLKEYSTVVWTTGNSVSPLTVQDRSVLRTYVGAGGSLVMFSQDILWGECASCSYWEEGSFARDVFGVRSSTQDHGEPEGNLSGLSGDGNFNVQYLPTAGLASIEISDITGFGWQDIISTDAPGRPMTEGFEYSLDVQDVEFEEFLGDWVHNSTITSQGSYSATSGWLSGQDHSETRDMEAYINSSSNYTSVSFDLRVLSESGYDFLRFYVDGTEQDSWSGDVPWQRVSFNIASGSHTLRWSYQKDSSVSWGLDRAWVDNVTFCCTAAETEPHGIDILWDEAGDNYAVVKMHPEGGRAMLYTMDPVQIDNRYDLETMLMQFIDWSDNEWDIGDPSNAAYAPVGVDGSHPALTTTGGTSWFQSRLFAGQNVRVASSIIWVWADDYDIVALEVTTLDGTVIAGAEDPDSTGMELEFQADEGGVYLISVTTAVIGDELPSPPWFQLSVTHLSDDNTVWLAAPTPITIDDSPVTDALAPQNWATQVGGVYADYSDSAFVTESLTQGERYGFGMLSLDTARSPDLQIYFLQNDIVVGSASGYLDGGELYARLVVPDISGPYEIQIYNLDEYGNPHLETFSYSVEMWSLPDCEPGTYQDPSGLAVCIEAPPGSYADDPSATSATVCPAGTYQPASGQASCIDAAGGHYVQDEGSTSQTPCPAGTYNPNTGSTSSSACLDADAGYFVASTGSASQTACAAGTYQPNGGQESCEDADAGYYVPTTAATDQTACALGTYQPSTGQSSCTDASAGYYVPSSAATTQIACSAGTYNPNTGSTSSAACIDASAGYYVASAGSASQTACSAGTYNPNTGSTSSAACTDASAGYYVANAGSASQTACAAGTYQPSTGQSSCLDASAGYYVASTGSASQTACAAGTYQPSTGQTSCTDASAGYYVDTTAASSQTACAAGTYQPSTGQASCTDASAGYYVDTTAASSQTACAAGTYQPNTGQASCIDASAGYYVASTGSASQTACAAGTYQPDGGQVSCEDADAGYYVPTTAATDQTACALGTYQPSTGQSSCLDASAGYYVDSTAATSQTECNAGTYQPSTGQTSCIEADPGYYVPNEAATSQTPCAAGTYQPSTGQTSCTDASAGYYVPTTAATDQTACSAGTYNPNTGSTSSAACIDASAGYYVASTGSASQTACAAGTYQPSTGQTSCTDASAGYYVDTTAATAQTPCPAGTYQPSTGQTSCTDASAGFYVDTTAASSQTACAAGTYQPSTGRTSCTDASAGYYVDSTVATSQTACAAGTYQPSTGQTSCTDASAGYYVDTTAASSQTACAAGTYQPSTGQTSCIDASAGYYVASTGSASQTACAAGTYQPSTGQSSCTDASAGYYVPSSAATTQIACSPGTYQPSTGQTTCLIADAGYYVASAGSASQTACAAGTYQPYSGQNSCLSADTGQFVASSGSPSQTPCPPGGYQPSTGQSSCIPADTGQFVASSGSPSQTPCPPGAYQPSTGQSSCLSAGTGQFVASSGSPSQTPCPPGAYQPSTGQVSCLDTASGQYSGEGASSPVDCSPGTYQPYSGQSSCLVTTPGHYTSDVGQSEQIPAPLDEYVVGTASSNTQDCPLSYITLQVGADSEEDCYLDSDGDRIHDTVDSDDDGDGVDDGTDRCPLGNMGWSSGPSTDNDGDGCRDTDEDSDDDNDGFPDDSDSHPLDPTEWSDNDMDGIGDNQDPDDDNDGVDDLSDVYPLDGTEWEDRNGDGRGDNANPLSLIDHMKLNPALTGVGAFALLAVIVGLVLMRRKSAPAAEDWKDDSYQSYSLIEEPMQPREESGSSGRDSDAQGHHDSPPSEEGDDEEAEEDRDEGPPPPPGFEVPPPPPPPEPDVPQLPPGVPPIPDGGLPEGWSIDQWIHYGKPWLDRQKAGDDPGE